MKRLVIYILLVTTFSGALAPLAHINAQTSNPDDLGTCQLPPPYNTVATGRTYEQCSQVGGQWTPDSANTPAQVSADPDETNSTGACSFTFTNLVLGSFDAVKCVYQFLSNLIYDLVLAPFAILLGLAGSGLDAVITYTILNMADKISGDNAFTGINIAWKLIRDLMNIFFIFILVYEAILLILGLSSTENIGKFIGYLVLAALLVNFSLFFTKILIDASNVVTIGIYNNIIQSSSTMSVLGRPIGGISVPFMQSLGLGKLFANESVVSLFDGPLNAIIGMIMGAIFMFIAAIIFIVISIMFIIRYVTLLLLLMLSPIGFMGSALSFMKDPAKKWWAALNSQLIFPPVYMLLTWVVLTLMQSDGFITASNAWDKQSYADNKISFVMNFIIIIVLMIASLIISKDISTKGSNFIKTATGKMSAFAGGAIIAGGASLARNTIGRRYDRLAQDQNLKDRAAQGDKMAQARLATYRSIASTNFDARGAFKSAGIDLGKATNKDGYRGAVEAKAKKEEAYAKSLKMTDYEKAQAKAKLEEYRKDEKTKLKEEEAKVNEFDKDTDIQKEFADKRKVHEEKIKEEEAKIKKVEEETTAKANADIAGLERNVQSADDELRELRYKLDNLPPELALTTDTAALRKEIGNKESARQAIVDQINVRKSDADREIRNQTDSSQQAIKNANNKLNDVQKDYDERRKSYISIEQRKLIADAGNPDKIDLGKDEGGKQIFETNARRINQYADYQAGTPEAVQRLRDSIEQKASDASESRAKYNPARYYAMLQGKVQSAVQPGFVARGRTKPKNHEVAAKIRGLNDKKTAQQLAAELLNATGEKSDTPATPAATPEAAATTPTDAGATPTA